MRNPTRTRFARRRCSTMDIRISEHVGDDY
jgi:hypothetical protein